MTRRFLTTGVTIPFPETFTRTATQSVLPLAPRPSRKWYYSTVQFAKELRYNPHADSPPRWPQQVAIAQYHRDKWNLRWENYKARIANIKATPAQRSHLSSKSVKMREGLQKAESTLATHIKTERIGLKAYLHSRNVPGTNSSRCD